MHCPIRYSRGRDEVRAVPVLIPIGQIVAREEFSDRSQRDELSTVSVSGNNEVRGCRGLPLVIGRLVIQHDDVFLRVDVLQKRRQLRTRPGGRIASPDDAEITDQSSFIFQNMYMVFLERLRKLLRREIPAVKEAFVVIAVGKPHAVFRVGLPQSAAGGQQIRARRAVVHEVTRDQDQVGLLQHDLIKKRRETLPVKGRADMGVCQLGDVLRDKDSAVVAVIAAVNGDKITFQCVCGKDAVAKGIRAGDIIKNVTAIAGGKGGGKPDSAMGGGNDVNKLKDALSSVEGFVSGKL